MSNFSCFLVPRTQRGSLLFLLSRSIFSSGYLCHCSGSGSMITVWQHIHKLENMHVGIARFRILYTGTKTGNAEQVFYNRAFGHIKTQRPRLCSDTQEGTWTQQRKNRSILAASVVTESSLW